MGPRRKAGGSKALATRLEIAVGGPGAVVGGIEMRTSVAINLRAGVGSARQIVFNGQVLAFDLVVIAAAHAAIRILARGGER